MAPTGTQEVEAWFVTRVPASTRQNARRGPLRVWGVLRMPPAATGVRKPSRLWRTSSIVRRLSPTLLETRYGTRVVLHGPLDHRAATRAGMTPAARRAFALGFPHQWRAAAASAFVATSAKQTRSPRARSRSVPAAVPVRKRGRSPAAASVARTSLVAIPLATYSRLAAPTEKRARISVQHRNSKAAATAMTTTAARKLTDEQKTAVADGRETLNGNFGAKQLVTVPLRRSPRGADAGSRPSRAQEGKNAKEMESEEITPETVKRSTRSGKSKSASHVPVERKAAREKVPELSPAPVSNIASAEAPVSASPVLDGEEIAPEIAAKRIKRRGKSKSAVSAPARKATSEEAPVVAVELSPTPVSHVESAEATVSASPMLDGEKIAPEIVAKRSKRRGKSKSAVSAPARKAIIEKASVVAVQLSPAPVSRIESAATPVSASPVVDSEEIASEIVPKRSKRRGKSKSAVSAPARKATSEKASVVAVEPSPAPVSRIESAATPVSASPVMDSEEIASEIVPKGSKRRGKSKSAVSAPARKATSEKASVVAVEPFPAPVSRIEFAATPVSASPLLDGEKIAPEIVAKRSKRRGKSKSAVSAPVRKATSEEAPVVAVELSSAPVSRVDSAETPVSAPRVESDEITPDTMAKSSAHSGKSKSTVPVPAEQMTVSEKADVVIVHDTEQKELFPILVSRVEAPLAPVSAPIVINLDEEVEVEPQGDQDVETDEESCHSGLVPQNALAALRKVVEENSPILVPGKKNSRTGTSEATTTVNKLEHDSTVKDNEANIASVSASQSANASLRSNRALFQEKDTLLDSTSAANDSAGNVKTRTRSLGSALPRRNPRRAGTKQSVAPSLDARAASTSNGRPRARSVAGIPEEEVLSWGSSAADANAHGLNTRTAPTSNSMPRSRSVAGVLEEEVLSFGSGAANAKAHPVMSAAPRRNPRRAVSKPATLSNSVLKSLDGAQNGLGDVLLDTGSAVKAVGTRAGASSSTAPRRNPRRTNKRAPASSALPPTSGGKKNAKTSTKKSSAKIGIAKTAVRQAKPEKVAEATVMDLNSGHDPYEEFTLFQKKKSNMVKAAAKRFSVDSLLSRKVEMLQRDAELAQKVGNNGEAGSAEKQKSIAATVPMNKPTAKLTVSRTAKSKLSTSGEGKKTSKSSKSSKMAASDVGEKLRSSLAKGGGYSSTLHDVEEIPSRPASGGRRAARIARLRNSVGSGQPTRVVSFNVAGAGASSAAENISLTPKLSGVHWTEDQIAAYVRMRETVAADRRDYWDVLATGVPGKTAADCRARMNEAWETPTKPVRRGAASNKSGAMTTPEVAATLAQRGASKAHAKTAKFRTNIRRIHAAAVNDAEDDDALEPVFATAGDVSLPNTPKPLNVADGTPGTEARERRRQMEGERVATPDILATSKAVNLQQADLYVSLFNRRFDKASASKLGTDVDAAVSADGVGWADVDLAGASRAQRGDDDSDRDVDMHDEEQEAADENGDVWF